MESVTIQQVRFEFRRIKEALERGEELLLTYRNKPLARLQPVVEPVRPEDDAALGFGVDAEKVEPLTNSEIDRAIYG